MSGCLGWRVGEGGIDGGKRGTEIILGDGNFLYFDCGGSCYTGVYTFVILIKNVWEEMFPNYLPKKTVCNQHIGKPKLRAVKKLAQDHKASEG